MKTKLDIDGMHCASCAAGIESFLKSQKGIEMAKVDFDQEEARIRYTDKADLEHIRSQIEDMGYELEA